MLTWPRRRSRARGGIVAGLDIGSSKVCCVIAQIQGEGSFEILGVGHQLSKGIKSGIVIDMDEVVTSIVNAVHTAEKMAGLTIRDVIISVNGAHLKSINFAVELNVSGHAIDEADIRHALFQARQEDKDAELQVLHNIPTGYVLDGTKGIRDPRGMYGDLLRVAVHTILSKPGALYNLSTCVARSHLEISGSIAAAYASGLACLVEDERELGAILIDMGGSTTSFAVFYEGQLQYTKCIPLGGDHVTMDIARCFLTTLTHAERLKTLHGSAVASASDDRETIVVPLVGEHRGEGINQMPRSALVAIIRPRIEETFDHIRTHLLKIGIDPSQGRRIVLTGGGSQLAGVREIASLILGKNIRLGRPLSLGSSEVSQNASFSTCIGLLSYGQAEYLAYLQATPQNFQQLIISKFKALFKYIW